MKTGDLIHVRARKTDGTVYRSWHARIESVETDSIVTTSGPGERVFDLVRGHYFTSHIVRSYYWFDKYYNLIEVFEPDGILVKIYLNIAAPLQFDGDGGMSFIDHELDVSKRLPHAAILVDEDEFAEAAHKYHYTEEFQRRMYATAHEALALADSWQAKPVPNFGGDHA